MKTRPQMLTISSQRGRSQAKKNVSPGGDYQPPPSHLSGGSYHLPDLAPLVTSSRATRAAEPRLPGLHRAVPSTPLDKSALISSSRPSPPWYHRTESVSNILTFQRASPGTATSAAEYGLDLREVRFYRPRKTPPGWRWAHPARARASARRSGRHSGHTFRSSTVCRSCHQK